MPDTPSLGEIPPPSALSIIICDNLWKDQLSGKTYILGTYSAIKARGFPAAHPQMAILVSLTNGRGKNVIRVRLIDTDEESEPLWEANLEVDFPDPRAILEFGFVFGPVIFPEPGEYRVQVLCGTSPIIERRLVVMPSQPPATEQGS